jgi:hypothetical protein
VKTLGRALAAAALIAGTAAFALAGEVVVLKGGTVIELKQPWVRRGTTAYLTRADGTLLSVPVSEIDREATAAAAARRAAPPPAPTEVPAATPAEVVRATRDAPKARVKITDADVSHPLDLSEPAPGEEQKNQSAGPGPVRLEVADYNQEKSGDSLTVRGTLRNPTQGKAENVRLEVTAMDEKGQPIDGAMASLSKGVVDSGQSVDFTTSLKVGDKTVASLRFAPQWSAPRPPPPAPPAPGTAAAAAAAAANRPPPPRPTPFGRGTIFAPPVANAPTEAPADGKTGYIPGMSSPDNQPKPPTP